MPSSVTTTYHLSFRLVFETQTHFKMNTPKKPVTPKSSRLDSPRGEEMAHREYRCVVMGGGGVGKSALTVRYTSGPFVSTYDPTVEDSYIKHVEFEGAACTLDIMDTAGQENYRALTESYIKKGQAFMVVFSVVSKISYEYAKKVKNDILKVKEEFPDSPIVLVGNKIDLVDREVTDEEAEAWVQTQTASRSPATNKGPAPPPGRMMYVPTSAKDNTNVAAAFEALITLTNEFRADHPELQPSSVAAVLKKKRCTLF